VTLSFWVSSPKTGTHIVELVDQDNSSRHINKSYTISTANTWEKKTITFAGDTTGAFDGDNGRSLDLNFWLAAGSTYTSGTLQTSWGADTNANRAVGQVNTMDNTSNNFYLTGVQLEVGSVATPFEHRSYDEDLLRCLRYYFEISGSSGATLMYMRPVGHDSDTVEIMPDFPVPMRASPTVTATGTVQIRSCATTTVTETVNLGGSSFEGGTIGGTIVTGHTWWDAASGTPFAVGYSGRVRSGASGTSINFTSEL
jgi:hypothetical protein